MLPGTWHWLTCVDTNGRVLGRNIVAAGYGVQVNSAVRLEADVEWIQFICCAWLREGSRPKNV